MEAVVDHCTGIITITIMQKARSLSLIQRHQIMAQTSSPIIKLKGRQLARWMVILMEMST